MPPRKALVVASIFLFLLTWLLNPEVETLIIDMMKLKARPNERIPKKNTAGEKFSPGILKPVKSCQMILGNINIMLTASALIRTAPHQEPER